MKWYVVDENDVEALRYEIWVGEELFEKGRGIVVYVIDNEYFVKGEGKKRLEEAIK